MTRKQKREQIRRLVEKTEPFTALQILFPKGLPAAPVVGATGAVTPKPELLECY